MLFVRFKENSLSPEAFEIHFLVKLQDFYCIAKTCSEGEDDLSISY